MISINLKYNNAFKWTELNDIWVKGYAFYKSQLHQDNALIELLKGVKEYQTFTNIVKNLNGLFSIVIKKDDVVWIASDIIRSFPVFWSCNDNKLIISDNPETFNIKTLNQEAINTFKAFSYTIGNDTLLESVKQLQAGQVAQLTTDKQTVSDYFSYCITKSEINYLSDNELDTQFKLCFRRTFESIGNRQLVIPLSGGFDSRLIATMAKNYGLSNVLCFTYGNSNNPEVDYSKKVADTLGYEWVFIEYYQELISGFETSEEFKSFYPYSSKYSSQFFLQEYFAVKYLKENKLIDNDCIFIPGHSGDFLGGSHLLKNGGIKNKTTRQNLVRQLFKNKLITNNLPNHSKTIAIKRIDALLNKYYRDKKTYLAYSIFEDWTIKERLSKIIANSSNVYDFFGYEYRFPFWDKSLVNTFKHLPYHSKFGKKVFNRVLTHKYFKPLGVFYSSDETKNILKTRIHKLKSIIKIFIPSFVKNKIQSPLDGYNSMLYAKPFEEELEKENIHLKSEGNYRNAIITHWYMLKIQESNEY